MPDDGALLRLFREQLENECGRLASECGLDERGHELIWWYFTRLKDIPPADVEEITCDGAGDLGIDAIHIDDENVVHFYQFKHPHRMAEGFAAGAVDRVIGGLTLVLGGQDGGLANESLRERIEEIRESVREGYCLHLVTSGAGQLPDEAARKLDLFRDGLGGPSDSFFTYSYENLGRLQDAFHAKNLPVVSEAISFRLPRQPYMTRAADHDCYLFDLPAEELVGLFTQHGEKLLQQNIRVHQGDSATNQAIYEACSGDQSGSFLHYNNGVTFLCEQAAWDAFTTSLVLRNAQVVNGGQTIRVLHGASVGGELQAGVSVIARVVTSQGDKEFASNVAVNQNNQNRMKSSFLRSNSPRVVQLANSLASMGWYLERREGEVAAMTAAERAGVEAKIGRPMEGRIISLKAGTQAYVATFYERPYLAKSDLGRVFLGASRGGHFDSIFGDGMTAGDFCTAYQLKSVVDSFIRDFAACKRRRAKSRTDN
jgi:hypothetical protein